MYVCKGRIKKTKRKFLMAFAMKEGERVSGAINIFSIVFALNYSSWGGGPTLNCKFKHLKGQF